MSDLVVTKTKMQSGVWEGVVSGSGEQAPAVAVTHLEKPVPDVALTAIGESGEWLLRVPVPADAIADGVQTLLISDAGTGALLERVTLITGEALSDDLRAEVDLLRAELDLLKRAFRRHCVDTA